MAAIKYKPVRKKPPKVSGFTGLLGNFLDDVEDAAVGFIPGIKATAGAVAHDVGRSFGATSGPLKTDDIAKAILKSYTDKGTFWGESGRAFADLARLDIEGARAHDRRAQKAFYDNPLGPLLDGASLFTGGASLAGKGGLTLAKSAPSGSASRALGARIAGVDAQTLRPLTRRVELDSGKGFDKKLARNPLVRARQNTFENISAALPDSFPVVGTNRRVGRYVRRQDNRAAAREGASTLRPMREALRGLQGLERKAVWIAAGGHKLESLMEFYGKRGAALEAEIARKKTSGETRGGNTLVVREDGKVERAKGDEEITYNEDDDFSGLAQADANDALKVNQRNLARVRKRIGELAKIQKEGYLDAPSKKLQRAVEAARELTAITTQRLVDNGLEPERAVKRTNLESRLLQEMGVAVEEYPGAIRSHLMIRPNRIDVKGATGGKAYSRPGKLAEAERNTGYNFWNARDDTNPAMYLHSARQVYDFKARMDRFESLLAAGKTLRVTEAKRIKGMRIVEANSQLRRDIDDVYSILVDAEPVLAGTPEYEGLKEALEASVIPGDKNDMVTVVPREYYDELVGEFTRSSAFIRRVVDNPTRVWRALTLNFRPAWIVNNIVGQIVLLGLAHGARGMYGLLQQFGKKGKLADELAPELTDFGWAQENIRELAGLGNTSKTMRWARRSAEWMGALNTMLSDSPTRRAAWIREMTPHVRKVRSQNPGMSWEDAARFLWNDADLADEVTQRVLSDMIDFSDLSNFERTIVKRAIPFYSWMKGMSIRTARLAADQPWILAGGAQLSAEGRRDIERRYGKVPSFMQSAIGVGGNNILATQGMNPFTTPSDVLGMTLGAFVPGRARGTQNPLATLNPVLKSPLQAMAGTDFFYGRDLDPKGETSLAQRFAEQAWASIPQSRIQREWSARNDDKTARGYTPTYEPSLRNAMLAYAGVPIRSVNLREANRRALEDELRGSAE